MMVASSLCGQLFPGTSLATYISTSHDSCSERAEEVVHKKCLVHRTESAFIGFQSVKSTTIFQHVSALAL